MAVAIWMSVASDIFSTLSVGSSDQSSSGQEDTGWNEDNSILEQSAGPKSDVSEQGSASQSMSKEESYVDSFNSGSLDSSEVQKRKMSTSENRDTAAQATENKSKETGNRPHDSNETGDKNEFTEPGEITGESEHINSVNTNEQDDIGEKISSAKDSVHHHSTLSPYGLAFVDGMR